MSRRRIALLLLVALVLASCGDDDDDVADAADATVSTYADGSAGEACSEPEPGPCQEQALAEAAAAYRATPEACDGMVAELPDGMEPAFVVTPGDTGMQVAAVACDRFAYQGSYELLGFDGSSLFPIGVEQWVDGKVVDRPVVLGNPVGEGAVVSNLEKARGPGDCGTFQVWEIDGEALKLTEARTHGCDDGADYVEPTEWELVYPA